MALKLAILHSGLRQRQIARQTGIDETRLSRIVSQQVRPYTQECAALGRVLRRSPAELFPGLTTVPRRRIA